MKVVVDPDDSLLEKIETNNTERILIDLVTGCEADTLETNNSFATASALYQLGDRTENGLSACDDDFF